MMSITRRTAGTAVLAAAVAAGLPAGTTAAAEPRAVKYLTRDGVKLAYVEAGQGPRPVLLVHGMQCSHLDMMPLFEHLATRTRVVAVDLRGHGASDKPHSAYDNREFNEDLVFLCRELGLDRPLGIGHSFGGSTLLSLAVTRPDLLGGLVVLDSGVRSAAARAGELKQVYDATTPGTAARRDFLVSRLFGPDDPPGVREAVVGRMEMTPDHVITTMQKTVLGFDAADAAAAATLPALFILSSQPFTDAATLARLGKNWRVAQVVGSGHFVQLVVPDQVNAMVDRFREIAGLA
jgi:pimeloyl-ACP methyl ester carboxylesterase